MQKAPTIRKRQIHLNCTNFTRQGTNRSAAVRVSPLRDTHERRGRPYAFGRPKRKARIPPKPIRTLISALGAGTTGGGASLPLSMTNACISGSTARAGDAKRSTASRTPTVPKITTRTRMISLLKDRSHRGSSNRRHATGNLPASRSPFPATPILFIIAHTIRVSKNFLLPVFAMKSEKTHRSSVHFLRDSPKSTEHQCRLSPLWAFKGHQCPRSHQIEKEDAKDQSLYCVD